MCEKERESERAREREKEDQGGGRERETIVRARESKVGMESKNIVHTPQLLKLRLPPSRQSPNTYVASDAEWRGDQEQGTRHLPHFCCNDALKPGIRHEHVTNRMLLRVLGACIARVRRSCQVDQNTELGRELLGLLYHLWRWLDRVAERQEGVDAIWCDDARCQDTSRAREAEGSRGRTHARACAKP